LADNTKECEKDDEKRKRAKVPGQINNEIKI